MTKSQSLELKGVAIIMMVLYHLFYVSSGGAYSSLITISGVSLIRRFSEICYPVSLYVMISGYGLYTSKIIGKSNKSDFSRIQFIYEHVWIILFLFVPIACILYPNRYPGNISELVKNVLCFSSSYNTEYWFLLPYFILLLLSGFICKLIARSKPFVSLSAAFCVSLAYLAIYKVIGLGILRDKIGVFIELYFVMSFVFPFTLGAIAKKMNLVEQIGLLINRGGHIVGNQMIMPLLVILFLIVFRMFVPNQSLQPVAVFILFLIYPCFTVGKRSGNALRFLGKHSLNIWLIHTWLCYYLFKDFIYGLKYPIVIFSVTLGGSIVISLLVELIYKYIHIVLEKLSAKITR